MFFFDGDKAHVRSGDGFANRGGVRRVVLAATASHAVGGDKLRRDQLDAVAVLSEQASMPMVHGGKLAMSGSSCSRLTLGLTSAAWPFSSTPCTAKMFLARSIPIVIMFMTFLHWWC